MNLADLQKHWDAFGRRDPMWAILTDPARKGRRWDAGEFFATGVAEITALMAGAAGFGLPRARRRALDFGCGLGRLTQALAAHADHVVGLDVAPSMIAQARTFNQHGARVDYAVQGSPPLDGIPDRAIDLVYTGRVLQHIAPEHARRYISELARVLAPGGFLSFDVPSCPLDAPALPAGAMAAGAYVGTLTVLGHEVAPGPDGPRLTVDVRVANGGSAAWPAGVPVNLGNHWLDGDGAVVVPDDQRVSVPLPLAPGQAVAVRFAATAPIARGARVLELDLVHEGVAWFGWLGSATVRLGLDGHAVPAPAPAPRAAPAAAPDAASIAAVPDDEPAFEPVMEMHAVHRADVEALLAAAGVRLLRVRAEHHCGPQWEAFRYDVTAD